LLTLVRQLPGSEAAVSALCGASENTHPVEVCQSGNFLSVAKSAICRTWWYCYARLSHTGQEVCLLQRDSGGRMPKRQAGGSLCRIP